MGGPGETVHVDEYLCSERSGDPAEEPSSETTNERRNYGNRLFGPWVLALCWKREDKDKILETRYFIVERRDAETLFPIIQAEIAPGTRILSDSWSVYESITARGFEHSITHESMFLDPATGKRTRAIEKLWDQVRRKYCLKDDDTLNSLYLLTAEEWWRSCNPFDTFNAFLRDMKLVYSDD
jgi:hypothetical protein